ncbi:MAG: hypothetical protein HQL13_06765 [Candidatus Omnitrophica bacterium]|nr:hypothetical protein [Candidatus Omnitrophota bacterium]
MCDKSQAVYTCPKDNNYTVKIGCSAGTGTWNVGGCSNCDAMKYCFNGCPACQYFDKTQCKCVPNVVCGNNQCGGDSCGNSCGTCSSNQHCNSPDSTTPGMCQTGCSTQVGAPIENGQTFSTALAGSSDWVAEGTAVRGLCACLDSHDGNKSRYFTLVCTSNGIWSIAVDTSSNYNNDTNTHCCFDPAQNLDPNGASSAGSCGTAC